MRKLPCGERVAGIFRIHRIRRIATERNAPWTAESLEQLQHDLVGSVGAPQLVDFQLDAGLAFEIVAECLTQRDMLTIRVTVERRSDFLDSLRDGFDHCRFRRIRILVDVEAYRHVQLRRTVRLLTDQIVAQRKICRNGVAGNSTIEGLPALPVP